MLNAGVQALEQADVKGLSLRGLARTVGVSATAVYRHFPDKGALLDALAQTGVDQLASWQRAATASVSPDEAFTATGRAYVRWALANPALFRLAFSQSCQVGSTVFGESDAAHMLRENALQLAGDAQGAERLIIQAWSVVHGLAMLMLDGQLPHDDALIDEIIDVRTLFKA